MADGFLSGDGIFYEKTEAYHAETARRVLGDDGMKAEDPIRELVQQGYIAFIEFRVPGEQRVKRLYSDLDYVICSHSCTVTKQQEKWIREHVDEITRRQQFLINDDTQQSFRNITISNVRLYPECEKCAEAEERRKWCGAEIPEEPERCRTCPISRGKEYLKMN